MKDIGVFIIRVLATCISIDGGSILVNLWILLFMHTAFILIEHR